MIDRELTEEAKRANLFSIATKITTPGTNLTFKMKKKMSKMKSRGQ